MATAARDRRIEDRISRLARRQHGVVTRAQLLEAGLSSTGVHRRSKAGRLKRLHRGVFRVGPLDAPYAREKAAELACGADAVVSHVSAGVLWELITRPPRLAPVDVTTAGLDDRSRPRIRIHRAELRPDERSVRRGIAVTTPPRTLVDMASVLRPRDLEQAVARAERDALIDAGSLRAMVDRSPHRRGIRRLRAVLQEQEEPAFTRSEAEERFLALVREARLPPPRVNTKVGGHEVDFYWPTHRLAVEVDGYGFHASRSSFERDRRRGAHLAALGVQVIHTTWRQIVHEGLATAVQLSQALLRAERDCG